MQKEMGLEKHIYEKNKTPISHKYNMGFIGGGLLYLESITIAKSYAELKDWTPVQEQVLGSNALQARVLNSAKRICREVILRLQALTDDELTLFIKGNREEQVHLLWLAVCKRYKYVFEFAVEVLRERYLRRQLVITAHDCDVFFDDKAEWHSELVKLTKNSREKVRQVVLKLLREAGLLSKQNTINGVLLSRRFIETVCRDSREYLAIFPVTESEVRELVK
jgi:hypothetical protein